MPTPVDQQITIADARDDGLRLVPEFYRKVIAVSFPPDELESEDELVAGLRSGRSRVLIAQDPGGAIVGGAVGDYFPRSDVMLLAYLAVLAEGRGLGVGAAVLHAAKQAWMAELNPRLIVLEVEDPREFTGSEAFGNPVARVRFYERHGVRALPLPYMQPALSPGTARVPGLMLMVAGGAAVPATGPTAGPADGPMVPGRHVASFLTEYFEEFEGPAKAGDTELGLLLAACDRPGGLRLMLARELPTFAEMRGTEGRLHHVGERLPHLADDQVGDAGHSFQEDDARVDGADPRFDRGLAVRGDLPTEHDEVDFRDIELPGDIGEEVVASLRGVATISQGGDGAVED